MNHKLNQWNNQQRANKARVKGRRASQRRLGIGWQKKIWSPGGFSGGEMGKAAEKKGEEKPKNW